VSFELDKSIERLSDAYKDLKASERKVRRQKNTILHLRKRIQEKDSMIKCK
jgi:predicted RNase H-like nuclease (RuvC/YqgF family)